MDAAVTLQAIQKELDCLCAWLRVEAYKLQQQAEAVPYYPARPEETARRRMRLKGESSGLLRAEHELAGYLKDLENALAAQRPQPPAQDPSCLIPHP